MKKLVFIIFAFICIIGHGQGNVPKDSLRADIKIEILPQALPKKASVRITPKIGANEFHSIFIQGDKAKTSFPVVPVKYGGTIDYFDVIGYDGKISTSTISIEIYIYQVDKIVENKTIEIVLSEDAFVFNSSASNQPLFKFTLVKLTKV